MASSFGSILDKPRCLIASVCLLLLTYYRSQFVLLVLVLDISTLILGLARKPA